MMRHVVQCCNILLLTERPKVVALRIVLALDFLSKGLLVFLVFLRFVRIVSASLLLDIIPLVVRGALLRIRKRLKRLVNSLECRGAAALAVGMMFQRSKPISLLNLLICCIDCHLTTTQARSLCTWSHATNEHDIMPKTQTAQTRAHVHQGQCNGRSLGK